MKKITSVIYEKYIYDSEEERAEHVKKMEAEGWVNNGKLREFTGRLLIDSLDDEKNYQWIGEFSKDILFDAEKSMLIMKENTEVKSLLTNELYKARPGDIAIVEGVDDFNIKVRFISGEAVGVSTIINKKFTVEMNIIDKKEISKRIAERISKDDYVENFERIDLNKKEKSKRLSKIFSKDDYIEHLEEVVWDGDLIIDEGFYLEIYTNPYGVFCENEKEASSGASFFRYINRDITLNELLSLGEFEGCCPRTNTMTINIIPAKDKLFKNERDMCTNLFV